MPHSRRAKPFAARAIRNIATILAVTAIFAFSTSEATSAKPSLAAQDPYFTEQP